MFKQGLNQSAADPVPPGGWAYVKAPHAHRPRHHGIERQTAHARQHALDIGCQQRFFVAIESRPAGGPVVGEPIEGAVAFGAGFDPQRVEAIR